MLARRNIWIICGAGYVSGKEIASLNLADGLRERGYDVKFMTSRWSDGDFPARLSAKAFQNRVVPLGFISKRIDLIAIKCTVHQMVFWPALAASFNLLAKGSQDQMVIHTNWHHAMLLLPFLNSGRDIFWLHETIPNAPRYAKVFAAVAKRTKCIVCVSEAVARSLRAVGIPQERLAIIHNGVKLVPEAPSRGTQDVIRFGIIGQIGDWKGHEDIFDALRILAARSERITLKIFGTGNVNYVNYLRHKVADLGLTTMVEWHGYVGDPTKMFSHVDVVLAPSRFVEPFGMSALEAAAFGRPVICSSQGGLPEIVKHGSTGFVVNPRQPEVLAEAMSRFIDNPHLICEMGDAGRRRAMESFSLAAFAEKFANILEERGSPSRVAESSIP
jgi:glycosyltransferase involved in cell wall biosynthesis